MNHKEFREKAKEAFKKSFAEDKEWIDSLGLDVLDEIVLMAKLENIFVNGMKFGVDTVKESIN